VVLMYKKGGEEADESTSLAFVSLEILSKGQGILSCVTESSYGHGNGHTPSTPPPKSFEEIKEKFVPTASFALQLASDSQFVQSCLQEG